jgi:hypothetical protein
VVFKQIDDGQAFATEHAEPLVDSQLTRYAFVVVFNTGQFNDKFKEWRNKPTTGKTWPLFKTFFHSMDKDRREQLTSAKGGFQGLAYKAMQVQTQEQPPWAAAMMQTVLDINTSHNLKMAEMSRTLLALSSGHSNTTVPPPPPGAKGYCHTHGNTHNPAHTSVTCTRPLPGHQTIATPENPMGGSITVYKRVQRPPPS